VNGRLGGRNDALEAGATIGLTAVIVVRIRVAVMMGRWHGPIMVALQNLFGSAREIRCEKQQRYRGGHHPQHVSGCRRLSRHHR
jgi:hypothetical protein